MSVTNPLMNGETLPATEVGNGSADEEPGVVVAQNGLESSTASGSPIEGYSVMNDSSGDDLGTTSIGVKIDAIDLNYCIIVGDKVKKILKRVSFGLAPGDMCALMGPSGAGKSTLLDLVAARKLSGVWSGDVYVDGQPRRSTFARDIAYVLQSDVHIPTLTVEETVRYAAWTRLEEGTSLPARNQRVDELLETMGLSHVRHSLVGDSATRGISGGQMKRLSIAVEMVALPRLIFLDEPTSGLDSAIAYEVMYSVRNFVSKKRTCMATIHQPSRDVFALFDSLLLLSAGRLIYFGRTQDALDHFTHPEVGFKFDGGYRNPAEFLIEITNGQRLPEGLKQPKQPQELELLYKNSQFFLPVRRSDLSPQQSTSSTSEYLEGEDATSSSSYYYSVITNTSMLTQLQMLLHRTWTAKFRDQADMMAQLIKNTFFGIALGCVFFNKGDISGPFYENGVAKSEVNSINSFLFAYILVAMQGNIQAIPYLCNRALIYRREITANAYVALPYLLAQLIVLMPIAAVFHVYLTLLVYWMVHLPANTGYFFYFLLITFIGSFTALVAAMAVGAIVGNETQALTAFPLQFMVFTTFQGYSIRLDDVPVYWSWMPYLAYPRWTFEGMMVNEWDRYGTDDQDGDAQNGYGDVLDEYSFDNFDKNDAIWIGLLFVSALILVVYYGLLPPTNRLTKVPDASDPSSVLSHISSSFSSVTGVASVAGRLRSGASTSGGTVAPGSSSSSSPPPAFGTVDYDDLQANLMDTSGPEAGVANVEVEEPVVEHVPKLSVDSFRLSSGIMRRAKGCRLVFQNLHYSVPNKEVEVSATSFFAPPSVPRELEILKGVDGRVLPGEMCALMGASGAGKSTLLDVLAQRKSTGTVRGTITYNGGTSVTSAAYVMQDNVHMGILTVRESVYYAAELRLPQHMSRTRKDRRVEKILDILGLQAVGDSVLGTHEMRGISGGQLKRVSIGVEIVNLPNLMFLDEPTTGLDSSIALEVMSAVRNLANQNRTVICTIHQPSEDVFALFDTLLLLAEGRVIYFGPALSATVVSYFTSSPFKFPYQEGANPAEFVVAVAGGMIPSATDGRIVTGGELAAYYRTTEEFQRAQTAVLASLALSEEEEKNNNSNEKERDSASAALVPPSPVHTTGEDGGAELAKEAAVEEDSVAGSESKTTPTAAATADDASRDAAVITPIINSTNSKPGSQNHSSVSSTGSAGGGEDGDGDVDMGEELPEGSHLGLGGRSYNTDLFHHLAVLLKRRAAVMKKDYMSVLGPLGRDAFVGFFYGSVWFQIDRGDDCDQNCYTDRLSLMFFSCVLAIMGHLDGISFVLNDRLLFYRERGAKAYGPLAYWLSLWVPQLPCIFVNALFYSAFLYSMCGLRDGGNHFFTFYFVLLTISLCSLFAEYFIAAASPSTEVAMAYVPILLLSNLLYAGYMVYLPSFPDWQGAWLPYCATYMRFAFQALVLNEFQNNSDLPDEHEYIDTLGFDFISIGGCYAVLCLYTGIFAVAMYLALRYINFEDR